MFLGFPNVNSHSIMECTRTEFFPVTIKQSLVSKKVMVEGGKTAFYLVG